MPLVKAATGLISALVAASQATHPGAVPAASSKTQNPLPQIAPPSRFGVVRTLVGNASWYGPGFHGHRTASGEVFVASRSTIASRHLPFGTRVRVTFLRTGRSAEARVNDRGPFVRGRIIDCSEGLARRIGLRSAGHGRVQVDIMGRKK